MSFRKYVEAGWHICAIRRGSKGPDYDGWNLASKAIPADAADGLDGAGLLHSLSGTCAIDLDDLNTARTWLAERGVDIDALLEADDAVKISSGRHNRAKLLYRMKKPLQSFKPKGSGLELRCATAAGLSVQDVLPETIHKDTKKPYVWETGLLGDWRELPPIPAALLTLWRGMTVEQSDPVTVETFDTSKPAAIELTTLRKAVFKHNPNCEHDEWLKVGMQLHDGTGGAQEGLDLWDEWSRTATRKAGSGAPNVYPGKAALKVRYLSFSGGAGKHVASGAALAAELPAEAEEFPIESEMIAPLDSTEALVKATDNETRKAKIDALEARLVYVNSAERYFDVSTHRVIGSDNAIEHMFTSMMPRSPRGGKLNPVKVLKNSSTKRVVDAQGFHPGETVLFKDWRGRTFANTYKDTAIEALEPTKLEREKITWLFDRIDDVPYREWLLQFFAHVVQFPGVKIKSAPLIWSEIQGNGKTTLLKQIPSLLVGPQYSREVTCALLNSDFNDYLLNAWHVNLTEFRAGSRGDRAAIAQKLRAWITDEDIAIHPKGLSAYNMPNHFFVTATSNEDDAAAIDNNDRRWAVHELHAPQFTESEQRWIYTEFLSTPRAAGVLRHFFLNTPIINFKPSAKAPETDARREMVESSTSPDMELLQTAWEQQTEPLNRDVVITNDVTEYVRKHSRSSPSSRRVGRVLCKSPFNGRAIQFKVGGTARYRAVIIRNHARWAGASGADIFSHINGEDVDLAS